MTVHPASSNPAAHVEQTNAGLTITLAGDWIRANTLPDFGPLIAAMQRANAVHLCGEGINAWDSSLVNLALQLHREGQRQGIALTTELPPGAEKLLALATSVPPIATKTVDTSLAARLAVINPLGWAERVGRDVASLFEFIGALLSALASGIAGRARVRLTDLLQMAYQTGPNALPIISLSSFLVGLILGYLGAVQLQQFGAGLYVANLVTVGVLREMGALMTAVIIAGRTGAAYAAQLGTMRVNEEIDAIEILGVSTMEFLVLPRVLAVVIMMPLLTLYADVLGILGGGIVASGLGISPLQYWTQAQSSLGLDHLLVGLFKSVLFGALIGIAGCRAGLNAGRDSAGVGRATTEAVVVALIYLIVADAAVNILCQLLEI